MQLLKTLILQRTSSPEIKIYTKLCEVLSGIARSKNPIISYVGSDCIKALFKVILYLFLVSEK